MTVVYLKKKKNQLSNFCFIALSSVYEFRIQILKCSFLAAIINCIEAMGQFSS